MLLVLILEAAISHKFLNEPIHCISSYFH